MNWLNVSPIAFEVNKKIAMVKGCNVETKYFKVNGKKKFYLTCGDNGNHLHAGCYMLPNWAENISDAWDLFEEMPLPCIDKRNGWNCEYTSKFGQDDVGGLFGIEYETYSADTAPLTICLAWLKWKESNDQKTI